MNVDLCFVPFEHVDQSKLPAVSGSSGHLVVERTFLPGEIHWPGQIFTEELWDYEEMMRRYAEMTRDRFTRGKIDPFLPEGEVTSWRKEWVARAERHQVIQQRRQEDANWLTERKAHHQIVASYRGLTRRERAEFASVWQAEKVHWMKREADRSEMLSKRKQENLEWHQHNQERKGNSYPAGRAWIAILVITDNCSRQCLSLPVFISGSKLTAEEVVTALRACLPKDLAFLITDQGTHFRCKSMLKLAEEADFIHVLIYRHRPQTNGIAERFVLTLKNWLKNKAWNGVEQLNDLLSLFRSDYNNRPHQGLAIPGLSPNEFANRIWLM
jgi:transposase InsO family protein